MGLTRRHLHDRRGQRRAARVIERIEIQRYDDGDIMAESGCAIRALGSRHVGLLMARQDSQRIVLAG
jgi:hypothetical protein